MRKLSSKEERDCQVIERLLRSYYAIVSKNIEDLVPKTIMHFMVEYVQKNLHSQLVNQLYRPDQFDQLLAESDEVCKHRESASAMLDALKRASDVIGEIRETQIRYVIH